METRASLSLSSLCSSRNARALLAGSHTRARAPARKLSTPTVSTPRSQLRSAAWSRLHGGGLETTMSAKNADDLVAKADKKLASFGFFGNKYEDAAELLEKAAVQYKLAKACEFYVSEGRGCQCGGEKEKSGQKSQRGETFWAAGGGAWGRGSLGLAHAPAEPARTRCPCAQCGRVWRAVGGCGRQGGHRRV